MSAWRQLLIGMSIRRYFPPIGTAGFERCSVSGNRRDPCPPPRMSASTSLFTAIGLSKSDTARRQRYTPPMREPRRGVEKIAITIEHEGSEIDALLSLAPALTGARVLEIGCGDGRLTRRYASRAG